MTAPWDLAFCCAFGCVAAFYGLAVLAHVRRLPLGHVLFSLLSLATVCAVMVLSVSVEDFLIGVGVGLCYCLFRSLFLWLIGRRARRDQSLKGGRRFVFFAFVTLGLSIFAAFELDDPFFFFLWPLISILLFLLLPRKIKRAMLRALPMGKYMGLDDIFPERIRYHPRQRVGGFSLIEVMIAFAILTIAFTGFFSLASGRRKLAVASERASMIRIAARSEIEKLKALPFDSLKIGSSHDFEIDLPGRNRHGKCAIEETDDPNVKLIRVTVVSKGAMAIEDIELVTLIAGRERKVQ